MLHFEGERDLPGLPAELWAKLRDARFLVRCIPGAESVKESDRDHAVCTIRPGLSFVKGTLETVLRVAEAVEPSALKLLLQSKGIGASSDVETSLNFAERDGKTVLRWAADVKNLTGLLKFIPQGLIRGAAEKVINDVWTSLAKCLKEEPPAK
jgi:carbon monoxide dehydrogenase subunit G